MLTPPPERYYGGILHTLAFMVAGKGFRHRRATAAFGLTYIALRFISSLRRADSRSWCLKELRSLADWDRRRPTALKFPVFCDPVSGFLRLVTVWLHLGRGGVTGSDGP